MQQLIKRLEVIKNCIVLGDNELITAQLAKLPDTEDERVIAIISALQAEQFSLAVQLIEQFVQRVSSLVVYEDTQIAGLRLELKALEQRLLALTEEKQAIQQVLNEFRTQYHLALGEWIQSVLDFKYRIAYQKTLNKLKQQASLKEAVAIAKSKIEDLKEQIKELQNSELNQEQIEALTKALCDLKKAQTQAEEAQETLDSFEKALADDEDYQEYQQAKDDKESFDEDLEEVIDQHQHELPEDQKNRLKKAYRKAAKLCHPDTVADKFKEQAHEIMTSLNLAYGKQNLTEVERILTLLESGAGFVTSSDKIDNSEAMRAKIAELTAKLNLLNQDVMRIKNDDTYQRLQGVDSWEDYFEQIKAQLMEQVAGLEAEYQKLVEQYDKTQSISKQTASVKTIDDDNYWLSDF
jgi:hypothetical protein